MEEVHKHLKFSGGALFVGGSRHGDWIPGREHEFGEEYILGGETYHKYTLTFMKRDRRVCVYVHHGESFDNFLMDMLMAYEEKIKSEKRTEKES